MNFRKMCKVCRYNIMDGEMYVIDYFPHPSERDSIGRPISNDVVAFRLRKYRIVPESERGNYLVCMWQNPTKGSHRGRDSFYAIVTQTVVGISRKFVGEWVKNQEWYVSLLNLVCQSKSSTNPWNVLVSIMRIPKKYSLRSPHKKKNKLRK